MRKSFTISRISPSVIVASIGIGSGRIKRNFGRIKTAKNGAKPLIAKGGGRIGRMEAPTVSIQRIGGDFIHKLFLGG
jgi:hypothetical protein